MVPYLCHSPSKMVPSCSIFIFAPCAGSQYWVWAHCFGDTVLFLSHQFLEKYLDGREVIMNLQHCDSNPWCLGLIWTRWPLGKYFMGDFSWYWLYFFLSFGKSKLNKYIRNNMKIHLFLLIDYFYQQVQDLNGTWNWIPK